MPSKTKAQHRFMQAAAHDKGIADKHGISQGQAKEFVRADAKQGKYQGGHKQGHGPSGLGKGKR